MHSLAESQAAHPQASKEARRTLFSSKGKMGFNYSVLDPGPDCTFAGVEVLEPNPEELFKKSSLPPERVAEINRLVSTRLALVLGISRA